MVKEPREKRFHLLALEKSIDWNESTLLSF